MSADLPSDKDSLALRYDNVLFHQAVDVPPGSPLYPLGRMLLGTLRNRLALGGIAVGSQKLTLPSGDVIVAVVQPGLNKIVLVSSRRSQKTRGTFGPFFLIYPCSTEYPFGYGVDEKGNPKAREWPYFVEEAVLKIDPLFQFPCISKIFYHWAIPDERKIFHPYDYPYGNQYAIDRGGNVWTWWHSGYGDLPHLVEGTYSDAKRFNQLYMPILCDEELTEPYMYFSQRFAAVRPVDNRIYVNGRVAFDPIGSAGYSMVSGVGFRRNGTVVFSISAFTSCVFYMFRGTEIKEIGRFDGDAYLTRPVVFDAEAERVVFLAELVPDQWKDQLPVKVTLHSVQFSIEESEDGVLSVTETSRNPYYSQVQDSIDVNHVSESDSFTESIPNVSSFTSAHTYDFDHSERVTQNTADDFPIAIYFDRNNDQKMIFMSLSESSEESTDSGRKYSSESTRTYIDGNVAYYNDVIPAATNYDTNGVDYAYTWNRVVSLKFGNSPPIEIDNRKINSTYESKGSAVYAFSRDYYLTTTVVYKNGEVCYVGPDGTEYRCNSYGSQDIRIRQETQGTRQTLNESATGKMSFLRYLNARQGVLALHELETATQVSGSDARYTLFSEDSHSEFIPFGPSWNLSDTQGTSLVKARGAAYDSITEKITTRHKLLLFAEGQIISTRVFCETNALEGAYYPPASTLSDPGVSVQAQIKSPVLYTTSTGANSQEPAPNITAWTDHPYLIATLFYRTDPSLEWDGSAYVSAVQKRRPETEGVTPDKKMIYVANEYGILVHPGPSYLVGKPGYETFDPILVAPTLDSFSNDVGQGQIYPIGWGLKFEGGSSS